MTTDDKNSPHPYPALRLAVLTVLLGLLFVAYVIVEYWHVGDFLIYYEAAKDLLLSKNIYTELYGAGKSWPYLSSPTMAFLLGPLTVLPFELGAALWKTTNILFLGWIWLILESWFDVRRLTKSEYLFFILSSFLSVSYVIYRNFALNQFTVFILLTAIVGTFLIFRKGKKVLGGCILALGICCKLMPIVLVPYLFFRREWRAGFASILFTAFWFLFPGLLLGFGEEITLLTDWMKVSNPNNDMNVFDVFTRDIHGVSALISTLFIEGIGMNEFTLQIRRHIVNLDPDTVVVLIQLARLALIGFTFFFLRSLPFVREKRPDWQFWEAGYILMVTPLIFPQQRQYAFFFLFPAIAYLTWSLIWLNRERISKGKKIPNLFYFYGMAILVFNLELILGHFREYYWHYKTLTYSVFALIFFYARFAPGVIPTNEENVVPESILAHEI